ncbi:MAG: hypothetical protein ACOCV4_04715, partial [Myxococcota bacterium]
MADGKKPETALGIARARFVEGLERRAKELEGSIALLTASPEADRPREELRRRLHALFASAQVFRVDPLTKALEDAIARLDAARDAGRGVSDEDLEALAHLATTLPGLGGAEPAAASPPVPPEGPPVPKGTSASPQGTPPAPKPPPAGANPPAPKPPPAEAKAPPAPKP